MALKKSKLNKIKKKQIPGFYGIVSDLPIYSVAYWINKELTVELKKIPEIEIYSEIKGENISFPLYYYEIDEFNSYFCFIQNSLNGNIIFENIKNIPYVILIDGSLQEEHLKRYKTDLKKIKKISSIISIDQQQIKELNNFLISLELHITSLKNEKLL